MKELGELFSFILEMDKLKAIYRRTTVKDDNNRQENSAEHSWHIALAAQVLQQYAAEPVAVDRVVSMLLIHDVVEIDAGDTFAFDEQHILDGQLEKELAAAERLFGLLPEHQANNMRQLWLEFEQAESNDARFAKAMDRILPLVQNMANNGGSWAHHKVRKDQVLARNLYLKQSAPKLWDYVCDQID
ncbi:MAG TPA: HD domain-containing protein, partial [Aeromonadales bacterium]|nr:HD domain-containing protein [Aeromonadales bacterium]